MAAAVLLAGIALHIMDNLPRIHKMNRSRSGSEEPHSMCKLVPIMTELNAFVVAATGNVSDFASYART